MGELIDETERLLLRELDMTEVPAYREVVLRCPEGIEKDLLEASGEEFKARHEAYIKYQYGFFGYGIWGLFLKNEPATLIGIAGVVNGEESGLGEVSYAILPEYRRQGYAYEAVKAVLEYGREAGFTRFIARIDADNEPSVRLARKVGLTVQTSAANLR